MTSTPTELRANVRATKETTEIARAKHNQANSDETRAALRRAREAEYAAWDALQDAKERARDGGR